MRQYVRVAIVGCLLACSLHGQNLGGYRGRGAAGRQSGPAGVPTVQPAPDILTDLQHAVAVQAFGDQPMRFVALSHSIEKAKQQAEALQRLVSDPADTGTHGIQMTALYLAIDDAQDSNDYFLKSFSNSQHAVLKERLKRLNKADSLVTREWNALNGELKRKKRDSRRTAESATRLVQALQRFHEEQLAIANEMGLQKPS